MLRNLRTLVADLLSGRSAPTSNPWPVPSKPDHEIRWEFCAPGVRGAFICNAPPTSLCRQTDDQECRIADFMVNDDSIIYEGCRQERVLATTAVLPIWCGDYYDWEWA